MKAFKVGIKDVETNLKFCPVGRINTKEVEEEDS